MWYGLFLASICLQRWQNSAPWLSLWLLCSACCGCRCCCSYCKWHLHLALKGGNLPSVIYPLSSLPIAFLLFAPLYNGFTVPISSHCSLGIKYMYAGVKLKSDWISSDQQSELDQLKLTHINSRPKFHSKIGQIKKTLCFQSTILYS